MTEYSNLSRDELEKRLRLAEDVCVLYGWTGLRGDESPRDRAVLEAWKVWTRHPGTNSSAKGNRELAAWSDRDDSYLIRYIRDNWPDPSSVYAYGFVIEVIDEPEPYIGESGPVPRDDLGGGRIVHPADLLAAASNDAPEPTS